MIYIYIYIYLGTVAYTCWHTRKKGISHKAKQGRFIGIAQFRNKATLKVPYSFKIHRQFV